jgi:DNA-binding transcriptional regulator YbjK
MTTETLAQLNEDLEVIRKDAIRLATVVVNLSKNYKSFQTRARGLGFRALSARQLWELEHVCRELRTVYRELLELECEPQADRGGDVDNPDLGPKP